jgi:hypothetical protein
MIASGVVGRGCVRIGDPHYRGLWIDARGGDQPARHQPDSTIPAENSRL